jgi:hypothetical protein
METVGLVPFDNDGAELRQSVGLPVEECRESGHESPCMPISRAAAAPRVHA